MSLHSKITIIVGCFNHELYVKKTLDSIIQQCYLPIQLIVFDDASVDDSVNIIENWIQQHSAIECVFLKNKVNVGRHRNLQEAVKQINGKYLMFLAGDDVLMPNMLGVLLEKLEHAGDDYAMIYGDSKMIDAKGNIIHTSMFEQFQCDLKQLPNEYIFEQLVDKFFFYIQATLIRASYFLELNYVFKRKIISEDWDIQLYLAKRYKVLSIENPVFLYRYLNTSVTRQLEDDNNRYKLVFSHFWMFVQHYKTCEALVQKNKIFEKLWQLYAELVECKKLSRTRKMNMALTMIYILGILQKAKFLNRLLRFYFR